MGEARVAYGDLNAPKDAPASLKLRVVQRTEGEVVGRKNPPVAFTFDDFTVDLLTRLSTRLGKSKSLIVREAIAMYAKKNRVE